MLKIPYQIWNRLVADLRTRGQGERESGAFLLGAADVVSAYVCFDDLDPSALSTGAITFHKEGFIKLWGLCAEKNLKVCADVHTHPGPWASQSWIDEANPMIDLKGHIAMILPHYATFDHPTLEEVGIHEYLGKHRWKTIKPKSKKVVLTK